MKQDTLDSIVSLRRSGTAFVLVTDLASGEQRILQSGEGRDEAELERVREVLRSDRATTTDGASAPIRGQAPGRGLFYQPFNPPLRLVIVGAVHIAQSLAPMAMTAGYDVTVVDPRGAFATEERFVGVRLIDEWPDDALAALAIDARTAVVTLTHDPKLDDPALAVALRSAAFYVGCLGSRKTHAARVKRLAANGFAEGEINRIHGPVGLAIGAQTPVEIALSILAQMTAELRVSPLARSS